MKRLLSISLLVLILFYTLGYVVVFEVSKYYIQKDIKVLLKKQIPESQLIIIKSNPSNSNQLTWYKVDKEFMYKGKMYDVVRSTKNNNSVTYYCISDSKETELRATLNKYVKENIAGNSTQNNSSHQLFKKFIQSLYTLNPMQGISCPVFNHTTLFKLSFSFAFVNLDVLSPPPKQRITV